MAVSGLPDTVKAGRHAFQKEAEWDIVLDVAEKLQIRKADNLLDIGCGPGNIIIRLGHMARSVTVVDHERVIDDLLVRPIPFPVHAYSGNFLEVRIPRYFDKILVYSVLHYLADEAEALAFLQKAYGLLRPGGMMLVGDIPNADKKRWFEGSQFGAAFSKAWDKRDINGNEFFAAIRADGNRAAFDNAVIRRLMKGLGVGGKDYDVLPQPTTLPFAYTREDILVTKPG